MKYTLAKVLDDNHDASYLNKRGEKVHYPATGVVEEPDYDPDSTCECSRGLHVTSTPSEWKGGSWSHVLEVTIEDEDILSHCPTAHMARRWGRLRCQCHCSRERYGLSIHDFADKLRVKKLTVVRCLTCLNIKVRQRTFTRSFVRLGGTLETT